MTDPSSYPAVDVTKQEAMDGSPCLVTLRHHYEAVEGGDPAHDHSFGYIAFQCGPISEVGVNGGTIEDVVEVVIARLEGFQQGPSNCVENSQAIRFFQQALNSLAQRTRRRQEQGVEGTSQPHES